AVLERLYELSDLRTNLNVNMVALVDGAPRTIGLRDALTHYLAHQREVLTRRTEHRLAKARARAHIVEGLLTALDHLDEVIALIRGAESAAVAKLELMQRLELTERQAQAVLDMQLRRLAALERAELEDEYQQLLATIEQLERILGDREVLDRLLADELAEIKRVHATPRRSRIVADGIEAADVLAGGSSAGFEAQDVTVLLTRGGYAKPLARRRTTPTHKHAHDPLAAVVRCTTDDTLLVLEETGTGHRIGIGDLPIAKPAQRGTHLGGLLGGGPSAPIIGAIVLREVAGGSLVTVSAAGLVKRTDLGEYLETRQRSIQVAGVRDGDRLIALDWCRDEDDLLLAHDQGLITRFPAHEVRPMGRGATGVAGMSVPDGARIVALSVARAGAADQEVVTVAADASAKRSPLTEYPVKKRGGKGLQTGTDELRWCGVATDLHLGDEHSVVLRLVDLAPGRRAGRGTPLGDGPDPLTTVVPEQTAPDQIAVVQTDP
ncbi:MAG: DNA gyrase subunit A, partial [Nitriliruptoraceae bacterium]